MPAIIANARAKGDLKENAEYHAAREKQGMLKAEMDKINSDLTQAQVIDPASLPAGTVTFGKTLILENKDSNQEETYTIVGPAETDTTQNKISVTSQLAKGLLGKKQNDVCKVSVPAGDKTYKIKKITV
jgi:transcription elongation factor GreA